MDNTQKALVLNHLQDKGTITSMEAFELYGIIRLAAVIFELRKAFDIDTIICAAKNRYGNACEYAKYKLIGIHI